MGEKTNAYTILVGKPDEKRPLRRSRRRWVYNMKIYCREIKCGCVDGIDLAQNRNQWRNLVNTVMNIQVL
jgi:hypothetical protein